MKHSVKDRESERGSAGIKFLVTMAVIMIVANAGINYVPVAYDAENLKSDMTSAILQGLALPGKVNVVENVKTRIQKSAQQNNIPPDAVIDVRQNGPAVTARVAYFKQVNILPFGLYKYTYKFDHTATPTGFLMKQ